MSDDRTDLDTTQPAPAVEPAPPVETLGRRELLRHILAGGAAMAGAAVAVSAPSLARAAEPTCSTEVDFRIREERQKQEIFRKKVRDGAEEDAKALRDLPREEAQKLRPKLQESRAKQFEESRAKRSDERTVKGGARYFETGPAPLWIEISEREELLLEVEQSSIRADVEGSCTVVMDLRVDSLDGGNVKEAIARIERLAPVKTGGESPLLVVTWGAAGDQGFEGYLDSTTTAYDAFLPDGTPVRAVIRATFLIA